ncbi:right-handed parallel beta-helix repeat-containing protein [Fulvivirga sp.]|uniref:right-handed parallel beta-helix repeat-containing protein n=1 Tax=Fulvivirga sp. TaxID=1931237 RepID=UPI0032EE5454
MEKSILFAAIIFLTCCGSPISDDVTPTFSTLTGCTDSYAINTVNDVAFSDNSCEYTPISCEECDFVLAADKVIIDNDDLSLPIGSVICLGSGVRRSVIIRNFHGTSETPYIFTNCDGQSIVDEDLPGIKLHYSSHIRLTGTGSTDEYGIKVIQGRPFGVVAELGTTDFEIDHLDISGATEVAIAARTRPVCDGSTNKDTFTQRNTIIHHNYLHDVGGEGTYVGGSHWHSSFPAGASDCPDQTLYEPELKGVRIYNNIVENTGKDGIQVGNGIEDCKIFNNIITNYGLQNITIHQAGIMVNPGTTGEIFSNVVKGGTGNGIFVNGFDNLIYSNLVIDCKKNAIHVGDREPLPGKSYRIVNNSLINIEGNALYMNSKLSANNIFYNNLMANIQSDAINKLGSDIDLDLSNNIISSSLDNLALENIGQLNFTPTSTSPLLDSGRVIDRDQLFVDLLMRERKSGEAIDVGAFEFQQE